MVIELLRAMRLQAHLELGRKAIRTTCPLERHAGEHACHSVIDVARESAVYAEGDHYVRTYLPHPLRQSPNDLIEVGAVELAVGKVEYLVVADVQEPTGRGKLPAAQGRKFLVGACTATIPRSGASRQADDRGLNPPLVIEQERAAECTGFVVRMSGYTKKSEHVVSVLCLGASRRNTCHRGGLLLQSTLQSERPCRCSKIMSPHNCNETLSPYQDGDDESERVPTGESD